MKKLLVIILALLMVCMCGCKNDIKDTNSNISNESGKVIKVNLDKAKMLFYAKNGDIVQGLEKEYVKDEDWFKEFTKENVAPKNFSMFNEEYTDFTYVRSSENEYTGVITDLFKKGVSGFEVSFDQDGDLIGVSLYQQGMKVFEDATASSEELAKRYLEELVPGYKYDYVDAKSITTNGITRTSYTFHKCINGIRTSDRVIIEMASSTGNFVSYQKFDVGKYDGIKIVGADMDAFSKKIKSCMKEVYKDYFVSCKIEEEKTHFEISKDGVLRINFTVQVTAKLDGKECKTTEWVAFDLN